MLEEKIDFLACTISLLALFGLAFRQWETLPRSAPSSEIPTHWYLVLAPSDNLLKRKEIANLII